MEPKHRKNGNIIYRLSKCLDNSRQSVEGIIDSAVLKRVSSDTYGAALNSYLMAYGRFAKLVMRDGKPMLDFFGELPIGSNGDEYFQPHLSTFRIYVCSPLGEKAKIKCYSFMGTYLDDYVVEGLNKN